MEQHQFSIRRACKAIDISRRAYYYIPVDNDINEIDIIYALIQIIENDPTPNRSLPEIYQQVLDNGNTWSFKEVKRVYEDYRMENWKR